MANSVDKITPKPKEQKLNLNVRSVGTTEKRSDVSRQREDDDVFVLDAGVAIDGVRVIDAPYNLQGISNIIEKSNIKLSTLNIILKINVHLLIHL